MSIPNNTGCWQPTDIRANENCEGLNLSWPWHQHLHEGWKESAQKFLLVKLGPENHWQQATMVWGMQNALSDTFSTNSTAAYSSFSDLYLCSTASLHGKMMVQYNRWNIKVCFIWRLLYTPALNCKVSSIFC